MKEIREIVKAYQKACQEKKKTALATVVHVEGSAYRRPGARMLITDDGRLTGVVSGGCLEGDALRKALHVMLQQKPMLVTYDTSDEEDARLGVGLGCNGIIHILIEPVDEADKNNPICLLSRLINRRVCGVLITLFSMHNRNLNQPGTCLCLLDDNSTFNKDIEAELKASVITDARLTLANKISDFKIYEQGGELFSAFIEVIKPPISLNIIGAGNDVIPLVEFASVLGWEINIFDGRPALTSAARFPLVNKVLVSAAEDVLTQVSIDNQTVFLLMTHNYIYDLKMLKQLLPLDIPYVGILGPKKKLDRILKEIRDDGFQIESRCLNKLYGPVGLDLGAETSEEIALSILSEIKAVMAGKKPAFLRSKSGPIHDHEPKKDVNLLIVEDAE